jgi:hypothetical protein
MVVVVIENWAYSPVGKVSNHVHPGCLLVVDMVSLDIRKPLLLSLFFVGGNLFYLGELIVTGTCLVNLGGGGGGGS